VDEFQFVKEIDVKTEAAIGAPPFLNTKPLIYGLENEVKFAVPSRLTSLFKKHQLQVILAPIVEFFKNPRALLLPEMAIASDGPVESVKFFYRKDLKKIKKVAVDSASQTSTLLLRLILAEKYDVTPEFVPSSSQIDFENSVFDGILVIGDRALEISNRHPSLDLGKCWQEMTGLPFVYACWMIDQDQSPSSLYKKLLRSKEQGLKNLERIAHQTQVLSPQSAHKYLTQNIRFSLGEKEKEGILLFQKKLKQMGILEANRELKFAGI